MAKPEINDVLQVKQIKDGRWQAHVYSGQYKRYLVYPKATNVDKLACFEIAVAFLRENGIIQFKN